MDCSLDKVKNGSWRELAKIKSTPILASYYKLDLKSPCGLEWIIGSYALKSDVNCGEQSLITEEPVHPTDNCEYELSVPDNEWVINLAKYSGVLREDPEARDLWVNPSVYSGVPQVKISKNPFPGGIEFDDIYFGETVIPPLSIEQISYSPRTTDSMKEAEPPSWPPIQDGLRWNRVSGYLYGVGSDYRVVVHSGNRLAVVLDDGVRDIRLKTRYYRPRLILLHPYIYVEKRMEENERVVSPLVSLYDPVNSYITFVSRKPIALTLKAGLIKVDAEDIVLMAKMPPHAALKTFYTLTAKPVSVKGYRIAKNGGSSFAIASFRTGPSLIDAASFSKGELMLRLFNPGIEEGYIELKFDTRVVEGWIDDLYLEGLYDRIRAVIPSPFLGMLKVRLKRGLTGFL